MAGSDAVVVRRPEILRRVVPLVTAATVLVTAVSDWGGLPRFTLVLLAAAALVAWCLWPALPLPLLAAVVCLSVIIAQVGGDLEPSLFLVSLLTVVVSGWTGSRLRLGSIGTAILLTPLAIRLLQPEADIDPGIWTMGVALPGLFGFVLRRQEILSAQLVDARRRLLEQVAAEERRQAAREVHDLVGHGLAAMLLQVTSARHVLRRDIDSADQALREAESVGRQSMRDLRRTVALLRDAGQPADPGPLPGLADLGSLVDAARAGGLGVELISSGSANAAPPGAGLAVYRIVQESLVNAARHAPAARTRVEVSLRSNEIDVAVISDGATVAAAAPGHQGFGLQGMRERAEAAGGHLQAGPTRGGWRVHGRIPFTPSEPAEVTA